MEAWGGVRMAEQLRLVCVEFHMVPIRETLYFSNVQDLFDSKGNFTQEKAYNERIEKFFDELLWYTKALKWGREHIT